LWTTASVTVRRGPTSASLALDEVIPGTEVTIAGASESGWTRVRIAGRVSGFIRSSYLTPHPPKIVACDAGDLSAAFPPVIAAGTEITVKTRSFLRAGPSCNARTLDVLEPGRRMVVEELDGNWYAVGGQGWERVFLHRSLAQVPIAP